MKLTPSSFYPKSPMLMIISFVLSVVLWAYVQVELRKPQIENNLSEPDCCDCAE